jgi:tRNA/tmRNA/rRNA uracil-C5-methylase (TrmA/RlmC/RlmD family)
VTDPRPGDLVELRIDAVAHGGHCVARHLGRVVFVRHTLPGEHVVARLTEAGRTARYWRADAVQVLQAAPDRVASRCPAAGPAGCGGCDWQHVAVPAQRALKADVVREQLRRLAGIDVDGLDVEAVPGDVDGLGWRTRMRLAVDTHGHAGLRQHRSNEVVALDDCPIAHPDLDLPAVLGRRWPPGAEIAVVGGSGQPPTVRGVEQDASQSVTGPGRRRERAAGRTWRVSALGFWQVHPGAADALVAAVEQGLQPREGESLMDLYSGVGLFAGALAGRLGPSGRVIAVESEEDALRDARRNLHDCPQVRLVHDRVDRYLASATAAPAADLVVLDPPRTGAGARVCEAIARRRPRAVAYVACDPAALGRDLRTFSERGYRLDQIRAFDIFPMTHHVECVVTLRPEATDGRMVADTAANA